MLSSSPCYVSSSFIPLPNIAHLTEEDALEKIDAEIARFDHHVRALRDFRNTIIPISRFPVEILSNIFSQCNEEDHGLGSTRYHSRLRISWVSRHWRRVALGDPALWSCISIYREKSNTPPAMMDYIKECFIRSKAIPLSVSYYGPISEALALCGSGIQRIWKLSIDLFYPWDGSHCLLQLPREWRQSAPLLVDLKLMGVILEDELFGGVSWPLRGSVTLSRCNDPWEWSIMKLSTITELLLWGSERIVTPAEVVSTLQSLPALEACTIQTLFASTRDPPNITVPPVCLPNLRYLSITDDVDESVQELLQRLDLPSASIELDYDSCAVSQAIFDQHVYRFKEYHGSSWKNTHEVAIRGIRGMHIFTVSFKSNGQPRDFTVNSQLPDFDPVVRASHHLELAEVRNLVLDAVSIKGIKALGPFPGLEYLAIQNMGARFIRGAEICWEQFFPSLTKLKVDGILYSVSYRNKFRMERI